MIEHFTPETLIASSTAFGVGATKIAGMLMRRWRAESSLTEKLRVEMREDLQELRTEVKKLETEIDFWKSKFYVMVEENLKLRSDVEKMEREIQALQASGRQSQPIAH